MLERGKFLGAVRNLTAAAVIIPFSVSSGQVYSEQVESDFARVEVVDQKPNENDSFLGQFDKYLETDYGKAIAVSLFLFSVANSSYRLQKSWEQDSKRKRTEAVLSSAFLISLSLNFLAQTETQVDPKITSVIIDAFTILNSAYLVESTLEADRHLSKRLSAFATAASLIALSSLISLNTLDKP